MKRLLYAILYLSCIYGADVDEEKGCVDSFCIDIGSSSRINPTLPPLDNESGRPRIESNDDRLVTQRIMQDFFSEDPILGSLIVPYFEKKLSEDRHSPSLDQKERAYNLKRALSSNHLLNKEDEEYINRLMTDVLKEALINKHNELTSLNANPHRPWTNRKIALCSAGTTVVTVLISSAVTMAIAFSEC